MAQKYALGILLALGFMSVFFLVIDRQPPPSAPTLVISPDHQPGAPFDLTASAQNAAIPATMASALNAAVPVTPATGVSMTWRQIGFNLVTGYEWRWCSPANPARCSGWAVLPLASITDTEGLYTYSTPMLPGSTAICATYTAELRTLVSGATLKPERSTQWNTCLVP